MRIRIFILYVLVLLVGAAAAARESKTHSTVVHIKVHSPALDHNHVGDSPDRDVSIYLPPDYDSVSVRYPVLYLLHGYTGDDRGWMNPDYVGVPDVMDRLLQRHLIEPMIIVMPNSFNRFAGSFYVNSALSGGWEDFIVHDLIDYVDTHYRTLADAGHRGIAGHSMGGYGALRLGMQHPEVFSAAYGMSPCCSYWDEKEDREDVMKAQRAKSLEEIVKSGMGPQSELALAAAFSPDLHNPPFGVDWPFDAKGQPVPAVIAKWKANLLDAIVADYAAAKPRLRTMGFDVGRQDQNEDILTGARRLNQQMNDLGIAHEYSEYNGTHNSGIAERMEKVVLPLMSRTFHSSAAIASKSSGGE
jgi:enterochelin esterase-like enzyme